MRTDRAGILACTWSAAQSGRMPTRPQAAPPDLAMLEVALEARAGLAEGGIPIGAALFGRRRHAARARPQPPRPGRRPVDARRDRRLPGRGPAARLPGDDDGDHAVAVLVLQRAGPAVRDRRGSWSARRATFHGGHDWLAEHGVEIVLLDDPELRRADDATSSRTGRSCGTRTSGRPDDHASHRDPRRSTCAPWLSGGPGGPAALAAQIDAALQRAGFLLVTGHGVDAGAARPRSRGGRAGSSRCPRTVKQRVRRDGRRPRLAGAGRRGQRATSEGTETPPDLKESFAVGADTPDRGPGGRRRSGSRPTSGPPRCPSCSAVVDRVPGARCGALADELLRLCAGALGLHAGLLHPAHATTRRTTFNINWYPPLTVVGEPAAGPVPDRPAHRLRHRDRSWTGEPGKGGLQVFGRGRPEARLWRTRPYDPDAFTINIGDLLARWTGDRVEVQPAPGPAAAGRAPGRGADVARLLLRGRPRRGGRAAAAADRGDAAAYEPVVSAAFIRERLDAITVGYQGES